MFMLPGRRLEPGEEIYTDWAPREGDNAILRAEAFQSGGAGSKVKMQFYTKNSEEGGDGNPIEDSGGAPLELMVEKGTAPDAIDEIVILSAATTSPTDPKGVEELLRCKLTCDSGGSWVTLRVFDPVWFDGAR